MGKTSIEWTEETWNPQKGCTRVSPGCDNCYAIGMAHRFSWGQELGLTQIRIRGKDEDRRARPDWTGKITTHNDVLGAPLRWKKPRDKVFVCSGSDLFHESSLFDFTAAVFGVMAVARASTFQVLTKRLGDRRKNALQFFDRLHEECYVTKVTPATYCMTKAMQMLGKLEAPLSMWTDLPWPLPNVWIGASVEDRERKSRIDDLRKIPAAVHFLSIEPLLEDLGPTDLTGIDWIIIGGEGLGGRPFDTRWAENLIAEAKRQGVAPFMKQVGSNPYEDGVSLPISDMKGTDLADFPETIRVREFPR